MKTKLIIIGILFFSLQSCYELTTLVLQNTAGKAIDKTTNNMAYGKFSIIESNMEKINEKTPSNDKVIIITGKFKVTSAPVNSRFADITGAFFYYQFNDSNNKKINRSMAIPLLDNDVSYNSLEVNKTYNFKLKFEIPANQWELVNKYKFLEFYRNN